MPLGLSGIGAVFAAMTTRPPSQQLNSFLADAAAATNPPSQAVGSFIAGASAITTKPPSTTVTVATSMTTKPPSTTVDADTTTKPPTVTNKSFDINSFKGVQVGRTSSEQVDPTRTEPPVNTTPGPTTTRRPTTTSAPLTCNTYNVNDPATLYDVLNDTEPSMYGFMLDCLQKKIIDNDRTLHDLVTSQEADKKDAITASEMNRGMRAIYQSDLFFTISKVFMFIILICAYIYFLKYTGIIQPIKDGAKIVKDNLDKVKDIKMPKIKMPEVTMPSIKMPTK